MEGLQRSAVSFRRQGSSGMVWDDKFLAGLTQLANEQQQKDGDLKKLENEQSEKDQQGPSNGVGGVNPSPLNGLRVERSRSNGGGRGFRTGKVSPAIEPPSPRVSACGCFGKKSTSNKKNKTRRRAPKQRVN